MGVTNIVRNGVLFLILFTVSAYGQSLEITFTVSDSGEQRELTAGMDVDATEGFDSAFDQFAPPVPPAPLSDIFDSRIRAGGEEYYRYFRPYTTEEVSYTIAYQLASGPLNIDWSDAELPEEGLIFFRYTDNGEETEINLRESQSHTFNSITSGSGEIELIIYLDGEEPPDIPDPPQLISPENHETDVELRPTFEWSEVEGADGYILHANVVNPSEMVIDVELTTNFYTPDEPLEPNRDFDWRVRAVKDGIEGEWSSIRRFTTGEVETTEPDPDADLSILFSVKDSSDEIDLVVGLDENATDGFDSDLDQFAPPPSPSGTFDSRIKAGGEDYFRFYRPYTTEEVRFEVAWQIGQGPLSINWSKADLPEEGLVYISYVNGGDIIEVSLREGTEYTFDSFTSGSGKFELVIHLEETDEPPIPPPTITITSGPEQDAIIDTDQVSFSWEGSSEESVVTGYEIELLGPVEESFATTETTYTFENLTDGEYTFRVRAQDEGDRYSGWAQRSFSVALPPPLPDVPGLVSPADEATGVPLQPELSWDQSANAENYDLQLSTQSTFGELIVDETGLENTEYSVVNTLAYETIYYWRVRAVNESGESDWSSVWSFTTEPEPPIPPPTIAITSGPEQDAVIDTDQVSFSWEGSSEESVVTGYEVELLGPVEESFATTETTYTFENLTNGEYTFRVRAQDEGDRYSGWAQQSFSVALPPPLPDVPGLVSPADEATGVSLQPELSWDQSANAESYDLQLSTENTFDALHVDETGLESTEYSVVNTLAYETIYYWRVRGINESGESDWSSVWSFTTEPEPPIPPPTITIISGPEQDAVIDTDQVSFSWEGSSEESVVIGYEVELLGPVEESFATTETTYTFKNLTDGEYTFRVRAQDEEEQFSVWADREFSVSLVADPLSAPELISPEDGVVIITDEPAMFSWSSVDGASSYQIQFDEEDPIDTGSNTEFELITSSTGNRSWKARALDGDVAGEWSETRTFTVEEDEDPLPKAPILLAPADGESGVDRSPDFTWNDAEHANSYDLQLSGQSEFDELILEQSGLSETAYSVSDPLNYETEYFWRVRGVNETGAGVWSEVWSFETEPESVTPPPTVAITSGPDSGDVLDTENVSFSWQGESEESEIAGYEVELNGAIVESFSTSETSHQFTGLVDGEYMFRVRAQDQENQFSEWAEREFTVTLEPDQLPAPELIAPEDGAVILTDEPTMFSWSSVDGASGYQIQFDEEDPIDTGSNTEFELITSTTGERSWKARALDGDVAGEWSETRTFTVEEDEDPPPPPEAPQLLAPVSGEIGVDRSPDFTWNDAEHADGYELQLSGHSDFDELILEQSGLSETGYSVSDPLNYETEYFWRVRGVNETGAGVWSEVWSFTTVESPAIDGLTIVEVDDGIELVWNLGGSSDVDQFNIYRGNSPGQLNQYSSTSAGTRFFVFQNIPHGVSFYAVTYVTTSGVESEFSNIVSYKNSSQTISDQWQLLSIPLKESEIKLENSTAYRFERVYRGDTVLRPGKGYWIRSSSMDESYSLRGAGMTELSIELNKGWNLIGSITGNVSVSSISDMDDILTTAPVFGYEETNRVEVTSLETGKGYWLYASDVGTISLELNQSSGKEQNVLFASSSVSMSDFESGMIIFTKNEAEQTIRISDYRPGEAQLYRYILPPPAPDPVLDVRTRSGYSLMYGLTEELRIRASDYPVGVRVESVPDEKQIYRILAIDDEGNEVHFNLLPGRQVYIDREYASLRLERVHRDEAILEAGIDPNYPNPFNPATNIRYRLAETSEVMVDVYDIVGRRVTTLVNSRQMPGQYTVQFDGSSLASGVYFLRIKAGSFVDIQKLTLIK